MQLVSAAMAGQAVVPSLIVLLVVVNRSVTALPWSTDPDDVSVKNALWNHGQTTTDADGGYDNTPPTNGKDGDRLRSEQRSKGDQDSPNNKESVDEGFSNDQSRDPAVGNVTSSIAPLGTAGARWESEYEYGDYEDEQADAEVSDGSLHDTSSPPASQDSHPTEQSDTGAEPTKEEPQSMASDSTGMDNHHFGNPFQPPWSFPDVVSDFGFGRNPSEESDAPTKDSVPHRRHPHHHSQHHRHPFQELKHVAAKITGEHSSPEQPSLESPSPEDPERAPAESGEVSDGHRSHAGIPDNVSSDSSIAAAAAAAQWSDRRTRNRNRPVIKPPESGQAGKRLFGEGHTPEEVVRMEALRGQLMKQLGLGEVPDDVPLLPPLPESLDVFDDQLDDMGDEDEEDFMAPKTTQVIIFADDVTSLCQFRRSTGCFYFDQHGRLQGAVTGAELWLHKQRDPNDVYQQKLVVSELESAGGRHGTGKLRARNIAQSIVTDVAAGWIKFDLTRTVQRWADKPHKNEGLAVRCKSCRRRNHRLLWGQKEGYRPLLVVRLRPAAPRRHRRSLDCGPGVESCCRQQFFVTFRDLDMPTVLQPDGFYANFCSGPCGELGAHYNHTTLIQAVRMRSSVVDEETRRAMTPCCSPTKLRTISILHVEDGALKTSHVPNLSVVACGCM